MLSPAGGIQAEHGQQPAEMVTKANQPLHEFMLAHQEHEWKRNPIKRYGHERPGEVLQPVSGLLKGQLTAKQSAPDQKLAGPAMRRDRLAGNSLVTPDENVTQRVQAPEEIQIFPTLTESGIEDGRDSFKY